MHVTGTPDRVREIGSNNAVWALSATAVWYADQLQVLVKWEDGKSSSLRLGCDYIATATGQAAPSEEEVAGLPSPRLAAASVA
jgi:hypothetical protein